MKIVLSLQIERKSLDLLYNLLRVSENWWGDIFLFVKELISRKWDYKDNTNGSSMGTMNCDCIRISQSIDLNSKLSYENV